MTPASHGAGDLMLAEDQRKTGDCGLERKLYQPSLWVRLKGMWWWGEK